MPARQRFRRIGLLLPSSNTTQEPEFTRILPDHVTLHVARLPLRNVDASSTAQIVADIEAESRKLADADVDAIVLAATAPSARNGVGYDQELIRRIEAASGRKATTAAFIAASGFKVLGQCALGLVSNLEIGVLDEETAYDMGVAVNQPEAQAVMLACGNWATLGIVDRLESVIGKPVLTTNQVSLWGVLRLVGFTDPVFGWGILLRDYLG
jgi:maleate isomerase